MPKMTRRRYGHDDILVTPLGLGCVPLGDTKKVPDDETAIEIIKAAFDSGINFLDTAPLYGEGNSERRVGLALKELKSSIPDDFVLNTKVGYRPNPFDYSEEASLKCVEESMNLLGVDHIDMVHIHDVQHSDLNTVMAGSLKALNRLREEGVIKCVGVAGGRIDMLIEYIETNAFDSVITHNRFNLLDQPANPLLDKAKQLGVSVINGAPYASGMLARPFDKNTTYVYLNSPSEVRTRAQKIASICKSYGVDLPQVATQFSVRDNRVGTTIFGASTVQQIHQTANSTTIDIPDDLWLEIANEAPPVEEDTVQGLQPQ